MAEESDGGELATGRESDDDELTTGQAAALAGVSRWKIQRDADAGKLPHRTLPNSRDRRFRRGDVQAYAGRTPDDTARRLDDHEQRLRRVEEHLGLRRPSNDDA